MRLSIQRAIKRNEFLPYYQPVMDVSTHRVVDMEVLLRWKKSQEIVPPSEFIPFLEQSKLLHTVTLQLIHQVLQDIDCKQVASVSINLPPMLLEDVSFTSQLIERLKQEPLPPKWLNLEITERQPIADLSVAKRHMEALKAVGVGFKLDDAGTGYGGFSYLQELPFDVMKIDRLFVANIGKNKANRCVIDEIIRFGTNIGMTLIAEGVETAEQSAYLLSKNVHQQQGFLFAKPMPYEQLTDWLNQYKHSSC
ncbi:EAL domain-containing protein [Vibrio sp. RE88]|uniref:EAL domain-containing protein n=1 Tax=Vibrio sp. RE88 TaxID=2607610 RepID=UPI0014938FAC|nr:EAL domain-containing protein [Vibrio sp. RE88]